MTTSVQSFYVAIAVISVNISIIFMCVLAVFTIIGVLKSVHGIVLIGIVPLFGVDIVGLPSHMANVSVVQGVVVPA